MIVLDASAAADVLLKFEPKASHIRERMGKTEAGIHVPHLFEIEALNTLRRHFLSGDLSEEREAEALYDPSTMRFTRYPHTPFIERI
ncbi:MAG: type II toxin-antitoxin system VapC family toxin [Rubrobacteraceae bacterium]